MSNYFILLICSLAVFRFSEFVAVDNGPFHLTLRLRNSCKSHPLLCELVTCMYCLGGWISMIAVAWLWRAGVILPMHAPLWWGGIWGGQAAILRIVRERK